MWNELGISGETAIAILIALYFVVDAHFIFPKKNDDLLFTAFGMADAVKDDVIYELKFVSELTHEHFLQCASYVVAMGKKKEILWNTRDNTFYGCCYKCDNKRCYQEIQ